MKKVKLIKSFAGYPVWEYELQEDWYYRLCSKWITAYWVDEYIHKDIVEWMKDRFEEIKERPTSWEELWKVSWYFIETNSDISKDDSYSADKCNKNVFKTKEQAEASIALAQITQLLDKYDIPEKSDTRYYKNFTSWNPTWIDRCWLLRFDTPEKRDHFYKHHKALIDKLAPFYIF